MSYATFDGVRRFATGLGLIFAIGAGLLTFSMTKDLCTAFGMAFVAYVVASSFVLLLALMFDTLWRLTEDGWDA